MFKRIADLDTDDYIHPMDLSRSACLQHTFTHYDGCHGAEISVLGDEEAAFEETFRRPHSNLKYGRQRNRG